MSQTPSDRNSGPSSPAEQAVVCVLHPLARLMIDHGLQLGQVTELLKDVLVQESAARYAVEGREVSDTRISLLTGVHRKDVKRLRTAQSKERKAKQGITVPAAVIARWISDSRFLNIDQTPRTLAKSPKAGAVGEPDFPTLVAEVSRDVSSRAVLDELIRLEAVTLQPDGYVALVDQAYVPRASLPEQLAFLGDSVGDHLSAAVHNVNPKRAQPAMLDQSAFSENLSEEQVTALHQFARQQWAVTLQKFLSAATMAEARSRNAPRQEQRVRFGVYFYEQDQGTPKQAGGEAQASGSKRAGGKRNEATGQLSIE